MGKRSPWQCWDNQFIIGMEIVYFLYNFFDLFKGSFLSFWRTRFWKKTPGPSLFLDVANDVHSVPSYVCQPRPLLKRSVAALESSQRMRTQRACPTLVASLMSYPQKTREQRWWGPGYSPEWNPRTRVRLWSTCRQKERSPPWWVARAAVGGVDTVQFCSLLSSLLCALPFFFLCSCSPNSSHQHLCLNAHTTHMCTTHTHIRAQKKKGRIISSCSKKLKQREMFGIPYVRTKTFWSRLGVSVVCKKYNIMTIGIIIFEVLCIHFCWSCKAQPTHPCWWDTLL